MTLFTRRTVLKGGLSTALIASFPKILQAGKRTILNDASRLNPTPVFKHLIVKDSDEVFIAKLRKELKEAKAAARPFAGGAARHSMGGQSIPKNGTAFTFNNGGCEIDSKNMTFTAKAGTRWKEVIATLDKKRFSPAVMQANNDFGVASTFAVNAHGWPAPYGPFGSTVKRIKMMLADGEIIECTPTSNSELFQLSMGGYGLFGVILEIEADMVPNMYLKPKYEVMPSSQYAKRFIDYLDNDSNVKMAYGRLSVAHKKFMHQALLVTYRPTKLPKSGLPKLDPGGMSGFLTRKIYRAQIGSDRAKRARWYAETVIGPRTSSGKATRNTILQDPVSNLASSDKSRTDILHEYFIPPERFNDFIKACQDIIPKYKSVEFLNVTVRYVAEDKQSVLAYAPTRRISAVMSFSQKTTPEEEGKHLQMTEELIERVHAIGGSYYLPYRLHARQDQFEKGYPEFARFIERKKHYDPGLLFQNALWQNYMAKK